MLWWKFRRPHTGRRLIERIEFENGVVKRTWDVAGEVRLKSCVNWSGEEVKRVKKTKDRVYLLRGVAGEEFNARKASFLDDQAYEDFVTHFEAIVAPGDERLMSGINGGFKTGDVEVADPGRSRSVMALAMVLLWSVGFLAMLTSSANRAAAIRLTLVWAALLMAAWVWIRLRLLNRDAPKLHLRAIVTQKYVSVALVRNRKRLRFAKWSLRLEDVWKLNVLADKLQFVEKGPFENTYTLDSRVFTDHQELDRFVAHVRSLGPIVHDLTAAPARP